VSKVQRLLLQQKQVLTYFKDLDPSDNAFEAVQYFGTKGFFPDYVSGARKPLERRDAAIWCRLFESDLPGLKQIKWTELGPLTRTELALLVGEDCVHWSYPHNRALEGHAPVLRGEMCRALYRFLARKR
jgi:hypothetical protein